MDDSHPHEYLSNAASIVLSLWLSLSSLAAVTGDAVVLWLLYKNGSLRTIFNRFLASLSVADLMVGLLVGPVWIVIRYWIQPPVYTVLCELTELLWIHTTAATTFNICCVSVDRFIAIRFPFRYQDIVTKKRCYTVITLVWLSSMGLSFSALSVTDEESIHISMLWISLTIIIFAVPLIVVSCSYIYIFKLAKKQFQRIRTAGENSTIYSNNSRVRSMKNFKAITTIGFVLGAFIITWIPSFVVLFVDCYYIVINDWDKSNRLDFIVWPWVETIAFTSSAINPFIYYFRNKEFRQAFRRTFRWLPCGRSKEGTRTTVLRSTGNPMIRKGLRPGNLATKETEL